jgi:hypothetical protein
MRTPGPALLLALVLFAGCASTTPASPSPGATTAFTAQVLGQILDEHDRGAYAITGGAGVLTANQPTEFIEGIEATAYHRATPGHAAEQLTVRYSPAPFNGTILCPAKTCTEQDGVYLRHRGDVIAKRPQGFVQVTGSAENLTGDRLATAVALAKDPRIAPTVDQSLADQAAANTLWRTDALDCGDATVQPPVALPERSGATEPVTPQALAAVVASHVQGSCAGDDSGSQRVEGTVYLGSDVERVSLAITTDAFRCQGYDRCRRQDDLFVAEQTDVAEDSYPWHLVVARRLPDGTHWLVVDEANVAARKGDFAVPVAVLKAIAHDPRVGATVDAALNQAGNDLPLTWRVGGRSAE